MLWRMSLRRHLGRGKRLKLPSNFALMTFLSGGAGRLNQQPINPYNESVGVRMKIDTYVECYCISESQLFNFRRKIRRFRHWRVIYQDGNNRNSTLERIRDFQD